MPAGLEQSRLLLLGPAFHLADSNELVCRATLVICAVSLVGQWVTEVSLQR